MVLLEEGTINLLSEPVTSLGDSLAVARPSWRGTRRLVPPDTLPSSLPNSLETLWKCWLWKGGSQASGSRLPQPSQSPLKRQSPLSFPPSLLCFNFSP